MATVRRPSSASEIRYAVIGLSIEERCGMIAARNHFPARTGIPRRKGAAGGGGVMPRRTPTRSRVPAKLVSRKARILKGSDDGALTTPRQGAWEGAASCRAAVVRFRNAGSRKTMKKPAADFSVRAFR
jgi:hypothetical protein